MVNITAVHGDITTITADAIVNAANNAMRGGGGVDGAIHRAGGPAILADCIARFPRGLATGDAGWTTAGELPARWVIHTVGPNYNAGQRDRTLLESCYRRSLQVADDLGAASVAFPLISAGVYGWPRRDAIAAAIQTIVSTPTRVTEVQLIAYDNATQSEITAELARFTALLILRAVAVVHERGYHDLRILPGMSGSGMYWRVTLAPARTLVERPSVHPVDDAVVLRYTTGDGATFAGINATTRPTPQELAEVIIKAIPGLTPGSEDPGYVRWYAGLLALVEVHQNVPIAYADYFDDGPGWEVGWGSGVRYPTPPPPPV